MSTPHCPVCGRWDGTHSGGCPQTGKPYPGQSTGCESIHYNLPKEEAVSKTPASVAVVVVGESVHVFVNSRDAYAFEQDLIDQGVPRRAIHVYGSVTVRPVLDERE
jgi:hypothetical protein